MQNEIWGRTGAEAGESKQAKHLLNYYQELKLRQKLPSLNKENSNPHTTQHKDRELYRLHKTEDKEKLEERKEMRTSYEKLIGCFYPQYTNTSNAQCRRTQNHTPDITNKYVNHYQNTLTNSDAKYQNNYYNANQNNSISYQKTVKPNQNLISYNNINTVFQVCFAFFLCF